MPYINLRTNKKIDDNNKENIKTKLGEDIKIIGKSEDWLMIEFSSNEDMFFRGKKEDLAYVEVKLYGRSDASHYKLMTESITNILTDYLNIPPNNIYVSYFEITNWGWNGNNF